MDIQLSIIYPDKKFFDIEFGDILLNLYREKGKQSIKINNIGKNILLTVF